MALHHHEDCPHCQVRRLTYDFFRSTARDDGSTPNVQQTISGMIAGVAMAAAIQTRPGHEAAMAADLAKEFVEVLALSMRAAIDARLGAPETVQ